LPFELEAMVIDPGVEGESVFADTATKLGLLAVVRFWLYECCARLTSSVTVSFTRGVVVAFVEAGRVPVRVTIPLIVALMTLIEDRRRLAIDATPVTTRDPTVMDENVASPPFVNGGFGLRGKRPLICVTFISAAYILLREPL